MHEMVLVIAVIVLTLLVMGGLLVIFRRWLVAREDLVRRAWAGYEAGGARQDAALGEPSGERRPIVTA
jgi:predicted DNA-binding transcriptional regulator